jgi:serine/threonine protein kinase
VLAADIRGATQTGAFFSVGYQVEDATGRRAYLKALNFEAALRSPDPARAMLAVTEQFTFEVDLLEFCKGKKLSRVVRAVDHGTLSLGQSASDVVQFIVFEPADGDLRRLISGFEEIDMAWAVSIVHQAAVGLSQLHGQGIAHQDVKPSNILSFGGKVDAKLADLGCASRSGYRSPRDAATIPGARQYAAPELMYGQLDGDWRVRRFAPDLYQLGSLICFLFTGHTMSALLLARLPAGFRPVGYGGTYAGTFSDAKIFVEQAYTESMDFVRDAFTDGEICVEMCEIMKALCHPDPAQRGYGGRGRQGAQKYSLEPFVSRLGVLQAKASYAARRSVRAVEGEYSAD